MAKQEIPLPPTKKIPIFVGKTALVRLINNNDPSTATIWLVDSSNKTIRPFISEDKFDQMFKDPGQAHKSVTTLPSDELAPGGLLGDFHVLDNEYGVKKDGSMKSVPFSPSQLQSRYGKSVDQNAENNAVTSLDGLFSGISGQTPQGQQTPPPATPQPPVGGTGGPGSHTVSDNTEPGMVYDGKGGPNDDPQTYGSSSNTNLNSGFNNELSAEGSQWSTYGTGSSIPATYVQNIMQNPSQLAFYIGALAYGGYTLADVYSDISRQYQISTGHPGSNVPTTSLISPTNTRSQNPQIDQLEKGIVPSIDKLFSNDPALSQFNAIQTPDYTNGQSFLVPGTAEYSAAIDEFKNNYFDIQALQASADTDAKNAYATSQYNQLQEDVQNTLGVSLSNNADQAWTQLDGLDDMYGRKAYGRRGIQGSGIESQETQDILNKARQDDKNTRASALNKYDQQQMDFLHASASEAQVSALTPAQRQAYGFTPSNPDQFSVATIMSKNPGMTQQDAQSYHDSIIDANGNYRSTLYSNYYQNKVNNASSAAETAIQASNDLWQKNNAAGIPKGSVVNPADVTPIHGGSGVDSASPLGGIQPTTTPPPSTTTPPTTSQSTTPPVTTPTVTPTPTPTTPKPSTGSSNGNFFDNFGSIGNPTQSNNTNPNPPSIFGNPGNRISGNQNNGNNNYA